MLVVPVVMDQKTIFLEMKPQLTLLLLIPKIIILDVAKKCLKPWISFENNYYNIQIRYLYIFLGTTKLSDGREKTKQLAFPFYNFFFPYICHCIIDIISEFVQTPLKYCINSQIPSRRLYGESCPVFCPNHYRPVCGASKFRSYAYRTFTNGCYLDMLNCRGDDFSGWYNNLVLYVGITDF